MVEFRKSTPSWYFCNAIYIVTYQHYRLLLSFVQKVLFRNQNWERFAKKR